MKNSKHATENKGPLVICHHCEGAGKIHLSEEMLSTLNTLKMFTNKDGATATGVCLKLAWQGHPTAINNRLNDLVDLGLATRKRILRNYYYKAVK